MDSKFYNLTVQGYWVEASRRVMPAAAGLYLVFACRFILERNAVDLHRLLYIGQSVNVNFRLLDHEREKSWRTQLRADECLCFAYIQVPGSELGRCEAALIRHYRPICNITSTASFSYGPTDVALSGVAGLTPARFVVQPTVG